MPEPRSLDHLLAQVARLHHERARTQFGALGLHRGQPQLIMALSEEDGRTHTELAEYLHVTPATVTKMVQRMESTGFVQRWPDADDQRVSRVNLTLAGRQAAKQLNVLFQTLDVETFAGFAPEERTRLHQLLLRVRDNLLRTATSPDQDQQ
ncbi:MAG: MarR family transcriptional regulator [Anaerolineae bacterium]|nr:MarR family transcriptional regulator [Anaerolineae bacterium]